MSSVAVPALPLVLTLMLLPNASALVWRPAPVIKALFGVEVSVCLPLSVAVPMRVDTFLQESHSGLTTAVGDGVNVLLEADMCNARIKAVGKGSSAKWLRALESAKQSPTAPARLQVIPIM